jgi:hypothetical protein
MTDRPASHRGRTLKLYLVDGSPSGVITAELGVSSVRAAVASRTALLELVRRLDLTPIYRADNSSMSARVIK